MEIARRYYTLVQYVDTGAIHALCEKIASSATDFPLLSNPPPMKNDAPPEIVAALAILAAFCKAKRRNKQRAARYLSLSTATLYTWFSGKCFPAPRNYQRLLDFISTLR